MADEHVNKTADPGQVKKAGERAKLTRKRELDDLLVVLSTLNGRRFIWRQLSECGIYKSSFHPSGSTVYFMEGRRDVGLKLLADVMEVSPEAYSTMATEAQQDEAKHG